MNPAAKAKELGKRLLLARYRLRYRKMRGSLRRRLSENPALRIAVAYLVNDNTKWDAHSVYVAMTENPRFDSRIFVCRQQQDDLERLTRDGHEANLAFFRERGIPIVDGFDEASGRDLSVLEIKPDIVFYTQPFGFIQGINDIRTVGRKALTCYIPYSMPIADDPSDYNLTFFFLLWRMFLPSELNVATCAQGMLNKGRNCVATGYPKIDEYRAIPSSDAPRHFKGDSRTRARLIYAPHHSFTNRLQFATFRWNGRELLEYAKSHPETSWVFKPHPRLMFELVKSGIMSIEEAESYYDSWKNLANATYYCEGNYIDIFQASDALVTDCVSFLGEYLPTGKPVLLLHNPASIGYNELGRKITETYYRIENARELFATIDDVVLAGRDPLAAARREAIRLVASETTAASRILGILSSALGLGG